MVLWEIINYILKKKKEKEPEEWEKEYYEEAKKAGAVEPLDIEALVLLRKTRKLAETIEKDYQKAVKTLREKRDEIKDPAIRALIDVLLEDIPNRYGTRKKSIWASKGYMIPTIIAAEAIEKGKHKDLRTFMEYLIGKTKALSEELIKELEGLDEQKIDRLVRKRVIDDYPDIEHLITYVDPNHTLYMIKEAIWKGPIKKVYTGQTRNPTYKYLNALYETLPRYQEVIAANDELRTIRENRERMYQKIKEYAKLWLKEDLGIDIDFLDKSLEEWEEEEAREEEKPTPGARILAHPDRYPTLTQKILLKTLILGELQRENNKGVDRNLYRAIRNLLTTPLTTANWYPLLTEWFENLEKGQHTSPLTHIIQKLPIDPRVKQQAYKYLALIEQGTPLNQIPTQEKQAFRQAIEQIKQDIWRNPGKYQPIIDQLLYTTGLNTREAIKTLIGIIDDLARIHTGEKTPRQIGILRDATQILHTIRNLEGKNHYIDPYWISNTLTRIINENIQDPLLRKAYHTTIQHYQQTNHQIPRNQEYLEKIIEKERELEEKLRKLQEGEEKLDELEVKRIAMLYRTLMLLTPHPTLEETKRFYNQIARQLTVKVGNEEFLPVHGPIAAELATTYSRIRTAPPEKKEEIVREEIAGYEPLIFITPHIEKGVNNILAKPYGKLIPMEEHEKFLTHLERTQMRRPIEK